MSVQNTSPFFGKAKPGDRIVTIDGIQVTKVEHLHLRKGSNRGVGIIRSAPPLAAMQQPQPAIQPDSEPYCQPVDRIQAPANSSVYRQLTPAEVEERTLAKFIVGHTYENEAALKETADTFGWNNCFTCGLNGYNEIRCSLYRLPSLPGAGKAKRDPHSGQQETKDRPR